MRRRRVRTALLLGAAVVLAGNAGAVPAFAATDPPLTVPVLVEPVDAGTVAGDVPISATSTAPSVQFYLNGVVFGTPVSVVTGTSGDSASTMWSTWGVPNASHIWTAADCNEIGCNAIVSTPATVTLANADPAMTGPLPGAMTGTGVTFSADAPGGGLAFFVDGTERGFDATAPYTLSLPGPLDEGSHTAFVQECDTTQAACDGPVSPAVTFVVKRLHPAITSVSPNPFSPRRDGRSDTTSFRVQLGGAQKVVFAVRNSNGQLVRGPHNLGLLGAGSHTYRWDGKTNAGRIAGDGVFTIVVTTSVTLGGAALAGTAKATVRVDNSPSNLTGMTGNGSTFYPVVDAYFDQFRPKVTVNEGGVLWLEIYDKSGKKVREFAKPHASKGTFLFAWDGRTAGGSRVRAGTYRYVFKARDLAGNRRVSPNFHVKLRSEHLVHKAKKYSLAGDRGVVGTSNSSCTQRSYAVSEYAHGLWLANVCDASIFGLEAIWADYTFSVAGAARYDSIRVEAYGNTVSAPSPVIALVYNWDKKDWDDGGTVALNKNRVDLRATFRTLAGAYHVSARRAVKVSIAVPNINYPEDFDIAGVVIVVHYYVLAR